MNATCGTVLGNDAWYPNLENSLKTDLGLPQAGARATLYTRDFFPSPLSIIPTAPHPVGLGEIPKTKLFQVDKPWWLAVANLPLYARRNRDSKRGSNLPGLIQMLESRGGRIPDRFGVSSPLELTLKEEPK